MPRILAARSRAAIDREPGFKGRMSSERSSRSSPEVECPRTGSVAATGRDREPAGDAATRNRTGVM